MVEGCKNEIILTYFDSYGRAEATRMLLNYAQATCEEGDYTFAFVDNRVTGKEWEKFRDSDKCPHGQLPVLEWNGKVYG